HFINNAQGSYYCGLGDATTAKITSEVIESFRKTCYCFHLCTVTYEWRSVEMDPAGTVTVEDQKLYIKIETLCGINLIEIHRTLSEVCDESTVDRSTVSCWVHRFRDGRMSTDDDSRPKDQEQQQMNEEVSEVTGISPTPVYRILTYRILTHDLKKRKISARWVPQCLTAEPKICANTDGNLNMSPPDFDLLPKLKEPMHVRCYPSLEELSMTVT
ncbi:hypothetical protein C0J52_09777, partial [Blattella germanica]